MSKVTDTKNILNRIATISAASLILGSATAYAAGDSSQRSEDNARPQSASQPDTNQQTSSRDFSEVDQNQDAALVWTEIHAVYDAELAEADWDEDRVFQDYDQDRNAELNADEYVIFVSTLTAEPAAGQASGRQSNQDQLSGSQQQDQSSATQTQQEDSAATTGIRSQSETGQNQQQSAGMAESDAEPVVSAAVVAITPVRNLSISEIKSRDVVNLRGEQIGDIEDVVVREDGTEAGLVVGVGGILGLGEKDIFVSLDQVRASEDAIVWETSLDEDALKNLPEFNDEGFRSVPEDADA